VLNWQSAGNLPNFFSASHPAADPAPAARRLCKQTASRRPIRHEPPAGYVNKPPADPAPAARRRRLLISKQTVLRRGTKMRLPTVLFSFAVNIVFSF